ncbi:MAG: hypothetical protein HQL50_10525 [Magnetococcales bacterium]|nr:hypothetical protein [Magnetococcales bacterium]
MKDSLPGWNSLKFILTKLPLNVVRYLSLLPALAIFALIHLLYVPMDRLLPSLAKRMPLHAHMMFWSPNRLTFIWAACFDLMHAPISYHFSKEEMTALAHDNRLQVAALELTHGTTWSLTGKKEKKERNR